MSRILNGDRSPTLDVAVRLVEALDSGEQPGDRPDVVVRLMRTIDPETRVEQALQADARLTTAMVADLMRCYRLVLSNATKS